MRLTYKLPIFGSKMFGLTVFVHT